MNKRKYLDLERRCRETVVFDWKEEKDVTDSDIRKKLKNKSL